MEIINGYNRKCKDSVGGVRKVWLCKYVKYSRSQILTDGNTLVSFPDTFIYSFHSVEASNASESMEQTDGGKFYNQSISLTFQGADPKEIELLQNIDFRILYLDNNGIYKIFGLRNGMEAGTITYETGGAKSSLNGFKINFTGKEKEESVFVLDLEDIGFIEEDTIVEHYLLLQNGDFFMLENNDNLILQNG